MIVDRPTGWDLGGDFQGTGTDCGLGVDGDANDDGVMDILDLTLLEEFDNCFPIDQGCRADFNCDGYVDILDLLILLSTWTPDDPNQLIGSCAR